MPSAPSCSPARVRVTRSVRRRLRSPNATLPFPPRARSASRSCNSGACSMPTLPVDRSTSPAGNGTRPARSPPKRSEMAPVSKSTTPRSMIYEALRALLALRGCSIAGEFWRTDPAGSSFCSQACGLMFTSAASMPRSSPCCLRRRPRTCCFPIEGGQHVVAYAAHAPVRRLPEIRTLSGSI